MARIDSVKNPTWEQILEFRNQNHLTQEIISILEYEVTHGNAILNIFDAGSLPDETLIVIQLKKEPAQEYDNIKTDISPYKKLYFHNVIIMFGTEKNKTSKF